MLEESLNQLNGWQEEEKEGWLRIRVTRGVTGVADGISGEIFEYLMARDDKDGIKRGGNSRTFRRLSKVGKGCLSHQPRREIASSDVGEGGEVIPYRVPSGWYYLRI